MAIFKVHDEVLIKCKAILESFTSPKDFNVKGGNLVKYLKSRKTKAEKMIKLLEEEYYV